MAKRAVLLVNLGTPEEPSSKSVKQFLRPFLSDRRVVDLSRLLWLPLLHLFILPFRSKRVAKLYQKISLKNGSPLSVYTQNLVKKVNETFTDKVTICDFAMSYGKPSIADKINLLQVQGCTNLTVVPLYPQYSVSTTAPVFDQVASLFKKQINFPSLHFIHDYHDHPLYIEALANSITKHWAVNGQAEKLIFSFHGIPKRYVEKGDPYQKQCEKTVSLVSEKLGLAQKNYLLAYQSRMGKEPWLTPYIDLQLTELAKSGCTSVDIICPAFAMDCLETLEEMKLQNRDLFLQAGGKKYQFIPCLNDSEAQVKLMHDLIVEL